MKKYAITTETMGPFSFTDAFTIEAEDLDDLKRKLADMDFNPDTKITIHEVEL